MTKIELVQGIGNHVCEDCGPNADCGEEPEECYRIISAIALLDGYQGEETKPMSAEDFEKVLDEAEGK